MANKSVVKPTFLFSVFSGLCINQYEYTQLKCVADTD